MILLRNEPRVLMQVPQFEWREPSVAQLKDQFGRSDRTYFRIRGWKLEGGLVHEKVYTDRDEYDYDLWRISIEEPYEDVFWEYATVQVLTASAGSNQTWTRQSDFNASNNSIECIGAGGTGGNFRNSSTTSHVTGGGGGAYAEIVNFAAASTETYQIAALVAGNTLSANGSVAGTTGGDSWFGGTTLAGADVGAKGGSGGTVATGSLTGASGGQASASIGTTKFNGGNSGSLTGASGAGVTGGGGAAGPNGAGGNGGNSPSTLTTATNGGQGDNGTGGTGGQGNTNSSGGTGIAGTEITGSEGSGGGGGGCVRGSATAGAGGNYGGGSGAGGGSVSSVVLASGQGIIIITYAPPGGGKMLQMFN